MVSTLGWILETRARFPVNTSPTFPHLYAEYHGSLISAFIHLAKSYKCLSENIGVKIEEPYWPLEVYVGDEHRGHGVTWGPDCQLFRPNPW